MKRRETFAAILIACQDPSNDLSWSKLKHLKSGVLSVLITRMFRSWQRRGGGGKVSTSNGAAANRVSDLFAGDRNFDGTFLKEMITFLLENADEILALILKIVGLFGASRVSSYELDELTITDQKIVLAVFSEYGSGDTFGDFTAEDRVKSMLSH